jgi:hypothetical protein
LRWLALSIGLSIALTVLANVWLRASPGTRRRADEALEDLASPAPADEHEPDRRFRVIVPWKAMLVASLALTLVINVILLAT